MGEAEDGAEDADEEQEEAEDEGVGRRANWFAFVGFVDR